MRLKACRFGSGIRADLMVPRHHNRRLAERCAFASRACAPRLAPPSGGCGECPRHSEGKIPLTLVAKATSTALGDRVDTADGPSRVSHRPGELGAPGAPFMRHVRGHVCPSKRAKPMQVSAGAISRCCLVKRRSSWIKSPACGSSRLNREDRSCLAGHQAENSPRGRSS